MTMILLKYLHLTAVLAITYIFFLSWLQSAMSGLEIPIYKTANNQDKQIDLFLQEVTPTSCNNSWYTLLGPLVA